jgi:pSer/pThr/pTyr-binding forkhead associated (FHA) protein
MTDAQYLLIYALDGWIQAVPLDRDRFRLGRSSLNDLCFADDFGLSRTHLVIERNGAGWVVAPLSNKGRTFLNDTAITALHMIGTCDRISAGHLVIELATELPIVAILMALKSNATSFATSTQMTSLEKPATCRHKDPLIDRLLRIGRGFWGIFARL